MQTLFGEMAAPVDERAIVHARLFAFKADVIAECTRAANRYRYGRKCKWRFEGWRIARKYGLSRAGGSFMDCLAGVLTLASLDMGGGTAPVSDLVRDAIDNAARMAGWL